MILGFIKRIVFGTIKKIIFVILVVGAIFYYYFSDSFKQAGAWALGLLNNKVQIDVTSQTTGQTYSLTIQAKSQIDAWLAAKNLNQYGDKLDTVYTGGSPLFNELTGVTRDRYEYLMEKYPELKQLAK